MLLRAHDIPAAGQGPYPKARRPLRVLMVVESAAGGTGRHVLDLAEGLIERGFEIHLIYSTGRADYLFLRRLSDLAGVHCLALSIHTGMHPSDAVATVIIRRYLREHGPFDAIHGHSSKGGALARLAAIGTSVPAFYTLHGLIMMDPGLPRWKWLMYLAIELALARRTRRVIAVSPEEARAAVRFGFGASRVAMVPNGLGVMRLVPRNLARQRLDLPHDALAIGFVGRLVEQKAPDVLIKAFARAAAVVPRARLIMVGSGSLRDGLHALTVQLGVAEKTLWLGECDARQVLTAFDLFTLPSRKEGLPYVVLEAMAAGLPVVATASAGVEILITPGENGSVIETGNSVAFGQALIELLSDPVRLASYASASRRRAQRFTIDAMVERTIAIYRGNRHTPIGTA